MKVTLKQKKLKSGKSSLYIEYYKGFHTDDYGKIKHDRDFEYLKLYIITNPKTAQDKKQNAETLKLAESIKTLREADIIKGKFNIKDDKKEKTNIFKIFDEVIAVKEKTTTFSNAKTYISTKRLMHEFFNENTTFSDLNNKMVRDFKSYIDIKGKTKHGHPLKDASKYSYFNRFITFLNYAYDEEYITNKKVIKVEGFKERSVRKEYLTHEELQSLVNTECKYPVLKRAFLFSCLTGLRWGDIHKLRWSHIRKQKDRHRIHFNQNKTNEVEYLPISDEALSLLGDRKGKDELVFTNLSYGSTMNTELLRWCMRAGITKHITFHCARHTNAILLLENGADIYTVQKRLGHKEIRTTQIYAKILDEKMNEAADLIPSLNIML